jgi:glycosyltransferase involved in cell wall biosynthesis
MATSVIPIMIKVWSAPGSHRYRYISRSLPNLLRSELPEQARVIVVDDRSTDPRLTTLLRKLTRDPRVEIWVNPERMGPNRGQEYNFPRVIERFPNAEVVMLCDDDIVYHPGWLQRLTSVYEESTKVGLKAVFSALNVPVRPHYDRLRLPTSEVLLKKRQAALNWLVPRDVYERVGPFRDTGVAYDTDYSDRMEELKLPVACLIPSYVQNVGYHGAYQSSDEYTARDFVGTLDPYFRARDFLYPLRRPGYMLVGAVRRVARTLGVR